MAKVSEKARIEYLTRNHEYIEKLKADDTWYEQNRGLYFAVIDAKEVRLARSLNDLVSVYSEFPSYKVLLGGPVLRMPAGHVGVVRGRPRIVYRASQN